VTGVKAESIVYSFSFRNFGCGMRCKPAWHLVKIPLKQESQIKKKILNNRLIIKDFFG